MSSLSHSKMDKKQCSITNAFGIPQCSNQPCNFENEVYDHTFEGCELDSAELLEEEPTSKRPNKAF